MTRRPSGRTGLLAALAVCIVAAPAIAQSEKPLLSQEIRAVAEEKGMAAAQLRFEEIYPSQADDWTVDSQGFAALGNDFMQAGDYESAEIALQMMTATMEAAMAGGSMPEAAALGMSAEQAAAFEQTMAAQEAAAARYEAEAAAADPTTGQHEVPAYDPGPVRDDLERFFGEYGQPGQGSARRTLFVTRSCDGYLVAGPVWADVSPWFMKSESDNTFTYVDAWTSVRLEFEGPSGAAPTAVIHDVEGLPSPAPRLGPLPAGWEKCIQPPERGS